MFLGVLLSPFALLYNDVQSSLLLVLQVWFYCTPVIYAPSLDGFLGTLSLYNPVAPLLNQTRDWLIGGESLFLSEAVMIGTASQCCVGNPGSSVGKKRNKFLLYMYLLFIAMPHLRLCFIMLDKVYE